MFQNSILSFEVASKMMNQSRRASPAISFTKIFMNRKEKRTIVTPQ